MTKSSDRLCQECIDVERILQIDINRLFNDLSRCKGRPLSENEKRYLCLSLSGDRAIDIARREDYNRIHYKCQNENPNLSEEQLQELVDRKLRDRANNIKTSMAKSINQYINDLMLENRNSATTLQPTEPRPPWSKVICFLRKNGYKKMVSRQQQSETISIEIDYEDTILLKDLFNLLRQFEERFGQGYLNINEIEQGQEGDEENEQE